MNPQQIDSLNYYLHLMGRPPVPQDMVDASQGRRGAAKQQSRVSSRASSVDSSRGEGVSAMALVSKD